MSSATTKLVRYVVNKAMAGRVPPQRNVQNKPSKKKSNRRPGRRGSNRSMTRAMPAAYAAHVRPRFNVSSRTATSAIVSGCDLIYPIPATLAPNSDTIFAMFPANPAYWMGTRISQFAPAYQNYRPLAFRVSYIPQVAVTQQGTVFMGTLWNEAAPVDNIQQSLFTSNGGCLTQCYVPADTTIKLGRNLQQNLFTMNESLNPDTCPFMFLAGVRGADVVPGYFYVSYTYEFRNPIGSAWAFNTSGLTTIGDIKSLPTFANMTFVLAQQAGGFGPGTQLDLEIDGKVFYHGSEITLDPSVAGVLYGNQQATINTNTLASYFTLPSVTVGNTTVFFRNFITAVEETVNFADGQMLVILRPDTGSRYSMVVIKNATGSAASRTVTGRWWVFTTTGKRAQVNTSAGTVYAYVDDTVTNSDTTGSELIIPAAYRVVIN